MSTPATIEESAQVAPLGTLEGLFEFYDGLRVRRRYLGLTPDCVRSMCRGAALKLGIQFFEDCINDLERRRRRRMGD